MSDCALCRQTRPLLNSHAIPAFAVRWIKETAASPYLRGAENPNLRRQDIGTIKLLCKECETRFSRDEGIFSENIFNPYVRDELDEKGCGQGQIKAFQYGPWLLRFAISLQWRVLATRPNRSKNEAVLGGVEEIWRKFLLGERGDTGIWENHMLFLQSLGGAAIPTDLKLGSKVNMYIMHSVDATTVTSDNGRYLGIYSKIGPIAFYTPLKPRRLKGNSDSKIHMQGKIKATPNLHNGWLNEFIFITRPNEAYSSISEKQSDKMRDWVLKNPDRVRNSMSYHLLNVDFKLERDRGT